MLNCVSSLRWYRSIKCTCQSISYSLIGDQAALPSVARRHSPRAKVCIIMHELTLWRAAITIAIGPLRLDRSRPSTDSRKAFFKRSSREWNAAVFFSWGTSEFLEAPSYYTITQSTSLQDGNLQPFGAGNTGPCARRCQSRNHSPHVANPNIHNGNCT